MQTIEEYQRYTRQLEGEVKKWHDAFDASEVMNRELAAENKRLKEKFAELHKTIQITKTDCSKIVNESLRGGVATQNSR